MFVAILMGVAVNGWLTQFSISFKNTSERSGACQRDKRPKVLWSNERSQNSRPRVMATVSSRSLHDWQEKNQARSWERRSWMGLLVRSSHQESQAHEHQN